MDLLKNFGWCRPEQVTQKTLFPQKRIEFLSKARVSESDLARWLAAGWLSSTYGDLDELDEPETCEILFIRNLARSGLSEDDVERLLMGLDKPYSYHPTRTAYSFAIGWVASPRPGDVDEAFQIGVIEWLDTKLKEDPGSEIIDDIFDKIFAQRFQSARDNQE